MNQQCTHEPTVTLTLPLAEARHLRDACHTWGAAHMDTRLDPQRRAVAGWARDRIDHAITAAEEQQ